MKKEWLGCVEFGNNNFYEVLGVERTMRLGKDSHRTIVELLFYSHDDICTNPDDPDPNEGIPFKNFIQILEPWHIAQIMEDLNDIYADHIELTYDSFGCRGMKLK